MKLYELSINLQNLWDSANELLQNEELTQDQKDEILLNLEKDLKATEGDHVKKCLDIACLIKGLDNEAEAIKREESNLAIRRKRIEKSTEWLRGYLSNNIEAGSSLKDARATLSWRKSQAVNLLVEVGSLPEKYQRKNIFIEANKTEIKNGLLSGDTSLQGLAHIEEKMNLQIK